MVPEALEDGTATRTYSGLAVELRLDDVPYQEVGIVCVDTLGLGKICDIFWCIGVIIVVLRVERNILRGPTGVYSMPRKKYPNLFKRSHGVLRALEPEPKCLMDSFQEIRVLCGYACIGQHTLITSCR